MTWLVLPVLFLIISCTLAASIFNFKNNACVTKGAYLFQFLRSNKKCFHIDYADLKMPERIKHFVGDNAEVHSVTTKDGYILQMFRLRHPDPKGVILMNPSYVSDSELWLSQGNDSLAYVYWQQGYDIWLSNHRGTDYSQKHVSLKSTDPLFWDFSFDEIGMYDVKAFVDHVHSATGSKMVLIGHSMSSTTAYIYAAMYPEEAAEKISLIACTGSVAYTAHTTGISVLFTHNAKLFWTLAKFFRFTNFFGDNHLIVRIAHVLYYFIPLKGIVPLIASLGSGFTPNENDPIFLGIFLTILSAQSVKPVFHYAQLYQSKRFAMFDYGVKENLIVYGDEKPLDYPLEDIRVPIYVIASTDDYLSQLKDVQTMYERLRPAAKIYGMRIVKGMNHVDPVFGRHRLERIWLPVLDLIDTVSYQS